MCGLYIEVQTYKRHSFKAWSLVNEALPCYLKKKENKMEKDGEKTADEAEWIITANISDDQEHTPAHSLAVQQ